VRVLRRPAALRQPRSLEQVGVATGDDALGQLPGLLVVEPPIASARAAIASSCRAIQSGAATESASVVASRPDVAPTASNRAQPTSIPAARAGPAPRPGPGRVARPSPGQRRRASATAASVPSEQASSTTITS
jgi:hypothetical protein